MGKLGALIFGAVVGLAYLDKKREDSRRRAQYEDPNSEDEVVETDLSTLAESMAETQTYRALCTPKYAPTPISSAERERQYLKQNGVNLANAKIYNGLTLRQGENRIRVLRIQPNTNLYANLSCTLEVVSMDSKYIALSYTWGSVYDRADINIGGQVFSATRDLEIALRHLRANSAERVIWIDAICINQGDKSEVSWHMDCMRDVYTKAEGTMIWIGEGNSRSDFTIEHFNNTELDGPKALLADYKKFEKAWRGLEELVDRPWWSRLWIVQEAIVSKLPLLVCGRRFWKFNDFTRLIGFAFANKLDNLIFSPVVRNSPFTRTVVLLEMFRKSWAEKSGDLGLHLEYYIMVFGLKHNCLNPSDKVRALLGLANDRDRRDVERAGYSSDESPSVIYRKIAAYIVTHRYYNSELDFLCLGRGPRRGKNFQEGMPLLPTWAPDLSIPPWESFPTLTRNAWESDDNFCASKSKSGSSTPYSREFENDGGISVWPSGLVLTVRGIVVDTVKDVGHVYDLDVDSIDFSSGTSRLTLSQKTHHKVILDEAIDLTRRASRRNEGRYPGN